MNWPPLLFILSKSILLQSASLSTWLTGFVLLISATAAQAETRDSLEFDNVWMAEAPPGAQVMVAYMNIKNTGDKILRLKPPQSADFKKIEFHRSFQENGLARMQHQPELFIPARSTLSLKPGSYHMMLFNPVRKLKAGHESTFYFQINDGNKGTRRIKVIAQVIKPDFSHTNNQTNPQSDHSHH